MRVRYITVQEAAELPDEMVTAEECVSTARQQPSAFARIFDPIARGYLFFNVVPDADPRVGTEVEVTA